MTRRCAVLLSLAGLLSGCGEADARRVEQRWYEVDEALRAGAWDRAEALAESGEEEIGAAFTPLRYFVRGSAAYARSLGMQAEAERPDGDPEARKMAYQLAEDALANWQMAAASHLDWPAARRNVERGLLHLAALREKKDAREKPPERTPPEDDPADPDEEPPEEREARPITADLPAHEVSGLLDLLTLREQEKRALREAERRKRSAAVEKDW